MVKCVPLKTLCNTYQISGELCDTRVYQCEWEVMPHFENEIWFLYQAPAP